MLLGFLKFFAVFFDVHPVVIDHDQLQLLFPRFSCQRVKGNMLCVMICNIHHLGMGFFAVARALAKVHQIDLCQRQKGWSFHRLVDILYTACYRLFLSVIRAQLHERVYYFLADFCIIFLQPLLCDLPSSVGNLIVGITQDLKELPFWNNFFVVCFDEFTVFINPFLSSYCLLFPCG